MKAAFPLILYLFLIGMSSSNAQTCTLRISGTLLDLHDQKPLDFSVVYLEETQKQVYTDTLGQFVFTNLCPGAYHLIIHHIGCDELKVFIQLERDTLLNVHLEHHSYYLQSVTVQSQRAGQLSTSRNTIQAKDIQTNADKPISRLLEQIPGVYSIRNGSGIAKPVIQGLSGNRVSILNNGVAQAGQQWGADHAPEIDPLSASQLTVLKGVETISYGGNGLGGLVLMEPGPIQNDPHMHGFITGNYQTNGRQFHAGCKLEQGQKKWAWRLTSSMKYSGDHKSPNYYLSNTGNREYAVSGLSEHKFGSDQLFKVYYSFFHMEPGILRGSHVGNLTDLTNAIGREIPFYTKNNFSYALESPRQSVDHHLLKCSFDWSGSSWYRNINCAVQVNHRKEFDIRRGSRSNDPALDLALQAYSAGWQEIRNIGMNQLHYGVQFRYHYNLNQEGTGVLPLIPDYQLMNPGIYARISVPQNQFDWEAGMRYDFQHSIVENFSLSLPRMREHHVHDFHNISIAAGSNWKPNTTLNIKFNAGWTQRSPEVNELYSNGLHQAVAGIEEGTPDLAKERSLKFVCNPSIEISEGLHVEASLFAQYISQYIYLEPLKEFRLTIRGAFPVFKYAQTDAFLRGADFLIKKELGHRWQVQTKISVLKGTDRNHQSLVNMPPARIEGSIHHFIKTGGILKSMEASVHMNYTFRQNAFPAGQDFLDPPGAYFLTGLRLHADIWLAGHLWRAFIDVDNLCNIRYRDYLNRLRYYADEEGINLRSGIQWTF